MQFFKLPMSRARAAMALVAAMVVTACTATSTTFPIDSANQAAEGAVNVVMLTPENIVSLGQPLRAQGSATSGAFSTAWAYKVGVGDVMSIMVFDHPELTLLVAPDRSAEDSGFRVQRAGTFFYPFVGQV